jgi:biopolymer transport protein ExbB
MLEFFAKGGTVMYPILLCSILALAIFLERLWSLAPRRVVPAKLFAQVERLVLDRRRDEAIGLCRASDSALARIMLAGLFDLPHGRERMREGMRDAADRESGQLERFIEALGTIASVSTLLGLLGTISGMIEIFSVISTDQTVNPPALASGISEALITTFAGLTVAIPALVAYKFLQARVDGDLRELEHMAVRLVALVEGPPEARDLHAVS